MRLVPATRPSVIARRWPNPLRRRARHVAAAAIVLAAPALQSSPAVAAPPTLTPSVMGEAPLGHGVFRFPQAVAVTAGGTRVYVGDQYSGVVQAFDGSGNWLMDIGSRAARSEPGRLGVVGGVAVDKSGHVFVLDAENDRVQAFSTADGHFLSGFGDSSTFDLMSGSASAGAGIVASGLAVYQPSPGTPIQLYVADSGNDRIEHFTLDAGTLAPTGAPALSPASVGLQNPQGLTLSADGTRLYVADDGSHRVIVLDSTSFVVLGQAGSLGGPPGSDPAGFFPYDVAVDGSSPARLYVADNLNGRVQIFDAGTLGFLGTYGNIAYGPGLGNLEIVRGVHSQPEAGPGVAVADTANNRIQRFDGSGNVSAAWGIAGRSFGYVSRPRGVAFTPSGGIAVADTFNHRIALYDPDGEQADQRGLVSSGVGYAVPGNAPGQFEIPSAVAFSGDGSMWIADTTNKRVVRELPDGTVAAITQPGAVDDPRGLAPSPDGMYVASRGTDSVVDVHADGSTTVVRGGLANPVALATTPDGSATYVADDRRIRNLANSAVIPSPDGPGSADGKLWDHPAGLAFAADGTLYVSEQRPGTPDGARVLRGTPSGGGAYTWDTLATEGTATGQVIEPAGVAVSRDGATLLVADSGNSRIQRFDAPGTTPPILHRLQVSIDQAARGTVTSDLPGIACVTDCTQGYGLGRVVTLTAAAKPGQAFAGWGGDCAAAGRAATCQLGMGVDHAVSASFTVAPQPVATPPKLQLASASITPKVLHPARRASRRLHRKARKATRAKVRITLNRPAKLTLAVQQGRPGRKAGSACVAPTRENRKRAKCTRFVALRGTRSLPSAQVLTTILKPEWHGRPLPAGNYRLAITLIDADGTRTGPLTRAFSVTR